MTTTSSARNAMPDGSVIKLHVEHESLAASTAEENKVLGQDCRVSDILSKINCNKRSSFQAEALLGVHTAMQLVQVPYTLSSSKSGNC